MVEVVVDFDYDAAESDELTIKVGEVIKNVTIQDGGWWEGELRGKRGVFPDNFVKVVKKEEKKDEAIIKEGPVVAELKNKLSSKQVSTKTSNVKRVDAASKKKVFAKTRFSYQPANTDELRLNVGDIVEVIDKEEEGWWSGSLNGCVGVFPSNFVEIITDEKSEPDNCDNKEKEKFHEIKGKKVMGVGLGNIFEGQNIKLKTSGSKKDETPKASAESSSPVLPPRPGKPLEKAKVLFSYSAENNDELSIDAGTVITILDKDCEDSGWWKGEYNGKSGVFPDNFVEMLPPEELKPKKPPPPATKVKSEDRNKNIDSAAGKQRVKAEEKTIIASVAPPPLPDKKPELSKKPVPPRPQLPIADVKLKENGTNDFDGIESTEPLKSFPRPKNPNRRPPSMELLRKEGDDNGETIDDAYGKAPSVPNRESLSEEKKPVPPIPDARTYTKVERRSTDSRVDSSAIDELKSQIEELRSNSVSKVEFANLKDELSVVKDQMEHIKKQLSKRIVDLMQEIDEEKKVRLSTQVEMERVKQLVLKRDSLV